MSGKIAGQCWDLKIPHNEMTVLQVMANYADDEGNNIYPSVGLIAWKADYDERTVQRIIAKLLTRGLLILQQPARGRGHPAVYAVRVEAGPFKGPYGAGKGDAVMPPRTDGMGDVVVSPIREQKGDQMSPISREKGDIWGSERVTFPTIKGDIAMSHDPLTTADPKIPGGGVALLRELGLGLTKKQTADILQACPDFNRDDLARCQYHLSNGMKPGLLIRKLENGGVRDLPPPPLDTAAAKKANIARIEAFSRATDAARAAGLPDPDYRTFEVSAGDYRHA
jgi:hypothetical protein